MKHPPLVFGEPDTNAPRLSQYVPVDVTQMTRSRMLVQAASGGGKSRLLRAMLEQTHGNIPHIVLDYEGEFYTLRERFDYVLAGVDKDIPVHVGIARVTCRKILETESSAIIDLSDLQPNEKREYVKLFLAELMALPRALWQPYLIVLDEAQQFCPEGAESQSAAAVIALCTQGRKRGFCAVLATQRISMLNKNAAAELANKLIGRTGLDNDVKRAGAELGMATTERNKLRELSAGAFYAYGPAFGPGVHLVQSGDIHTTHIDVGTKLPAVTPPSELVRSWIQHIGDLPAAARADMDELDRAKAEIVDLRTRLRNTTNESAEDHEKRVIAATARGYEAGAAEWREVASKRITLGLQAFTHYLDASNPDGLFAPIEREVSPAMARAMADANTIRRTPSTYGDALPLINPRELFNSFGSVGAGGGATLEVSGGTFGTNGKASGEFPWRGMGTPFTVDANEGLAIDRTRIAKNEVVQMSDDVRANGKRTMRKATNGGRMTDTSGEPRKLGKAHTRILTALFELSDLGIQNPSARQVAAWAGVSDRGGHWTNTLSELRKANAITTDAGTLQITEAGMRIMPPMPPGIRTLDDLHARVWPRISGPAQKLLRVLISVHPYDLNAEGLAKDAGVSSTGGHFTNTISELRTIGFLTDAGKKRYRASDILFPRGLK